MRCGIHIGFIACMKQFYDIFGIHVELINYLNSHVFCALHTQKLFLSRNVDTYYVTRCVYACSPHFSHMKPSVQTMVSVLPISFHPYSEKYCHRHRQCILDPLVIPPHYPAAVQVKYQVPLPSQPSQSVLVLLGFSEQKKDRPHHRIHNDIKYHGG